MASNANNYSNTKLAIIGGSLVVSVGAVCILGVAGGIELHQHLEFQRMEALPSDPPSSQPSETPSDTPSLRPSAAPSLSTSPSAQPSVSASPSAAPSDIPSISTAPSISAQPSSEPSGSPSSIPSTAPSVSPSLSAAPSISPTASPTHRPTPAPTPQPTKRPVSVPSSFRLRLHWQRGDFWQDQTREMWYCMACANCGSGATDNCNTSRNCRDGMKLALSECRPGRGTDAAKFSLIPGNNKYGLAGDQIKIANNNLCLSLEGSRLIRLERCNSSKKEQRFLFDTDGIGFEIAPTRKSKNDGKVIDKCLTQHHHPRDGERIYSEICRLARISDTNLWRAY